MPVQDVRPCRIFAIIAISRQAKFAISAIAVFAIAAIMAIMSDPQIALKRWFHEKTKPRGTPTQLAAASGYTQTQIARMRNLETDDPKKRQQIPLDMIERSARFFNELPPGFESMTNWLDDPPGAREVRLVGYVGAGAEAHYYASGDEGLGTVTAPENATASTVAVEIRGASLGELFDHWLVFYDDVRSPVTPDLYNQLCVVGLADDKVLVKKIKPSKSRGLFHLLSNTEGPITDVPLLWAARVKSMVPR